MRENDFNYIKEVTEFFNSTRSEDNPKGNISAVTEKSSNFSSPFFFEKEGFL